MTLRILSFGAGVQSSYVARMSIIGDIEPFDHVIFADTGDEPQSVYDNVAWWADRFRSEGVEFHTVAKGSIADDVRRVMAGEIRSASNPPFHLKNPDGSKGFLGRKCTRDHKVAPINRKVRELVGVAGKRHTHITDTLAVQTIGISWDEAQRMRDPAYPWLRHSYPLVERRITRAQIVAEMAAQDEFPEPARSACWHCPFHSDMEWRYLRDNEPAAFAQAVEFDAELRRGRIPHLHAEPYLHASLKPLSEVDFDNEEDKGQQVLWGNECEGMCGL